MPIEKRYNAKLAKFQYIDTDTERIYDDPEGTRPSSMGDVASTLADDAATYYSAGRAMESKLSDGRFPTAMTAEEQTRVAPTSTSFPTAENQLQDNEGLTFPMNTTSPTAMTLEEQQAENAKIGPLGYTNPNYSNKGESPEVERMRNEQEKKAALDSNLPALNFAGSDLTTELYTLGTALGAEKGTPGRNLGIVSSLGSAVLGGTRDVLSGFAAQKASQRAAQYYDEQRRKKVYTSDDQYRDNNSRSSFVQRDGGEIEGGGNPRNYILNPHYAAQLKLYQTELSNTTTKSVNPAYLGDPNARKVEGAALRAELEKTAVRDGKGNIVPQYDPNTYGNYMPTARYVSEAKNAYYDIYSPPSKFMEAPTPEVSAHQRAMVVDPVRTPVEFVKITNPDGTISHVAVPFQNKIPQGGTPFTRDEFERKIGKILPGQEVDSTQVQNMGVNKFANITFPADYGASGENPNFTSQYRSTEERNRARTESQREFERLQAAKKLPKMKAGGTIKFMHGGKEVQGIVDRVENGKVYLK